MSEEFEKKRDIEAIRDKLKQARDEERLRQSKIIDEKKSAMWSEVAFPSTGQNLYSPINFGGKNLEEGKYSKENFENANFSASNLKNSDFSGANLKGVDLTGADLTGANLSGADLTGAMLSGAKLIGTNFTGAKLNSVIFTDADIQDAILLDVEIDELGLEELQALVEYLAKYFPHKLNLLRMNLTLLDLSKIDLKNVNLRGVDFTGVNFTGVNIMELDLSECIITPQQIAQALGRVPNAEELKRLMAPKPKKKDKFKAMQLADFFVNDGKEFGVWDFTKDYVSIEDILKVGKKIFKKNAKQPDIKDEELLEKVKTQAREEDKTHNAELRKVIEERKRQELEARQEKRQEFQKEIVKNQEPVKKEIEPKVNRQVSERVMIPRDYSRD